MPKAKPVSLHPLTFDAALRGLLRVPATAAPAKQRPPKRRSSKRKRVT